MTTVVSGKGRLNRDLLSPSTATGSQCDITEG